MPKKHPPTGADPMLKEIMDGIGLVKTETDRGAALVGGAMLDEGLRAALGLYFEPDVAGALLDEGTSPLQPFSARIKMAHALTIIERKLYLDLEVIRGIRNDAAHFDRRRGAGFNTGFDNTSIKDRVLKLHAVSPEARVVMKNRPRIVYEMFCITLSARFQAAVSALHAGMALGRFNRDHARRGIRQAAPFEKVREQLTLHLPRVKAERERST